jgi:tetratricopeptide (TPR) repeat protein
MRALVVSVLLASSVAYAQPDKIKAEAAARDGQQRYQAGEFQLAAERFELAYQLDPDPAYLFNLAQAYRLGNSCAKAAAAYRKLLGIVSTGPNVAKVEQYVQQMDVCAKRQEPVAPTPVTPSQPPSVEERPPPPAIVNNGGSATLRHAGIGVTTAGAIALVIGVVATKKVADLERDREALCANGCVWEEKMAEADMLNANGKTWQRRMQIAYIGGGIAVAGGLVMMWLARERTIEVGGVGVSLAPTADGAMAFGTLAF